MKDNFTLNNKVSFCYPYIALRNMGWSISSMRLRASPTIYDIMFLEIVQDFV